MKAQSFRVFFFCTILLAIHLGPSVVIADGVNVIYLTDGTVIRGNILSQVPGESVVIQVADGTTLVISSDELTKIEYETTPSTEPTQEEKTTFPALTNEEFSELEEDFSVTTYPSSKKITSHASEYRYPGRALAWSLIVGGFTPVQGAGQFYNGQIGKGIAFTATGTASWLLMRSGTYTDPYTGAEQYSEAAVLGALLLITNYVWSSVDAYRSASKINQAYGFRAANDIHLNFTMLALNSQHKPLDELNFSYPTLSKDLVPGLQFSMEF